MKKSIFYSILFYFGISILGAQDIGYAINIKEGNGTEDKFFYDSLISKLEKYGNSNFVLYDWQESKLNLIESEKFIEKPVELAVFIKPIINFDDPRRPEVITTVDTNGIINGASFAMNYDVIYQLKVINVKTGVVEDNKKVHLNPDKQSKFGPKFSLEIDHKKYFGSRKRTAIRSKQYNAIKQRLYKDYREKIDSRFLHTRLFFISKLPTVIRKIHQAIDMNVYKVTVPDKNADKITKITIDGGSKNSIIEGELFDLYAIVTIGDKRFSQAVSFVAADKVSSETTICKKTFFQSKKKFTRIMKEYDQLYTARNISSEKNIMPFEQNQIVNLSIDMKTNSETWFFENHITKQPMINVIERKLDAELDQLRRLYKDERFIDYKLSDLQDQRLGSQYLLTYEAGNVSITEIASGKMVSVDNQKGTSNWYLPGYDAIQSLNMALLKVTNKSIEIVKVLKEKKGKVKIVQVYNPLGFNKGDDLDISIIRSEKINGITYNRKEFIAKGFVLPDETLPNIGELRISKKGRKALFNAIQNKDPLDLIYSYNRG